MENICTLFYSFAFFPRRIIFSRVYACVYFRAEYYWLVNLDLVGCYREHNELAMQRLWWWWRWWWRLKTDWNVARERSDGAMAECEKKVICCQWSAFVSLYQTIRFKSYSIEWHFGRTQQTIQRVYAYIYVYILIIHLYSLPLMLAFSVWVHFDLLTYVFSPQWKSICVVWLWGVFIFHSRPFHLRSFQ